MKLENIAKAVKVGVPVLAIAAATTTTILRYIPHKKGAGQTQREIYDPSCAEEGYVGHSLQQ